MPPPDERAVREVFVLPTFFAALATGSDQREMVAGDPSYWYSRRS
jgi:hypothetical protein